MFSVPPYRDFAVRPINQSRARKFLCTTLLCQSMSDTHLQRPLKRGVNILPMQLVDGFIQHTILDPARKPDHLSENSGGYLVLRCRTSGYSIPSALEQLVVVLPPCSGLELAPGHALRVPDSLWHHQTCAAKVERASTCRLLRRRLLLLRCWCRW